MAVAVARLLPARGVDGTMVARGFALAAFSGRAACCVLARVW